MKLRKLLAAAIALGMLSVSVLSGCDSQGGTDSGTATTTTTQSSGQPSDDSEKNELTATEVIKLMGNGINLGNTMEAYNHQGYLNGQNPVNFENAWGQPTTTQEMINDMKEMGFDSIRIPVAWTNGMNFESGDYTIDERLLARVEEIVNYALNADMYVIINDHWDGGWWGMFGSPDMEVRKKAMDIYKSMWSQIAERFCGYSYKLIFESANEELGDRLNDSDISGTKGTLTQTECYEKAYEINSEFVKLIRSTGGKNADRFLLIAGYNTDITMTCDDRFKMPEDTAEEKLILSVHYYTPWDYCGTEAVTQWGSPTDIEEQNTLFEKLTKFTDKGYGVIIGEYAVMTSKGFKPDTDKFYTNLLDNCDYYNYCPVLWDCSNLYKRRSGEIADEAIAKIFKDRCAETEKGVDYETIKKNAKASMDALIEKANEELEADISLPPSDDMAIAWIMYQSGDYGMAYSVGDTYDPTNMTTGIKATNVQVTGEGTYTVSLDFTKAGKAKGVAFSALGISNGETFFPGYIVAIDEILINGEVYTPEGKGYTSSDNGKCTRVNLYNQWVSSIPDDARVEGGDLTGATASLLDLGNKNVETISITFRYIAPEA